MSCYIKNTNNKIEVRVESGSPSILFNKLKIAYPDKSDEFILKKYNAVKKLETDVKDSNGEPFFNLNMGSKRFDDFVSLAIMNGMSISELEQINKEFGVDNLIDFSKKLIQYAKGDMKALEEELAHFATATVSDTPTFDRLLTLIETHPYFKQYYAAYKKKYNGNDRLARKEVLDKIFVDYLNDVNTNTIFGRLLHNIKLLIEQIKELFGKPSLYKALNDLDNSIKLENSVIAEFENVIQYRLDETEVANLAGFEKVITKAIDNITDKIKLLRTKSQKSYFRNIIEKLEDELRNKQYNLAVATLVNSSQEKLSNGLERLKSLTNAAGTGKVSMQEIASVLVKIGDEIAVYDTMMENFNEFKVDEPALKKELDKVVVHISDLKTEYKRVRKIIVGISLLPQFKGNPDLDTIEKLDAAGILDEAMDIGSADRWLLSLSNSSDDYLRVTDLFVKEAEDRKKKTTMEEVKELLRLIKKVGTKDFTKFIQKVNGKLGSQLISGKLTEQWGFDKNKMLVDARNLLNLSEDFITRKRQFNYNTDEGKAYFEYAKDNITVKIKTLRSTTEMNFEEFKNNLSNKTKAEQLFLNKINTKYNQIQAVWFSENSKPIDNVAEVLSKRLRETVNKNLYADAAQYRDKVFKFIKDSGYRVMDVKEFTEELFNSLGPDVLPDIKEDIMGVVYVWSYYHNKHVGYDLDGLPFYKYELSEPNNKYNSSDYNNLSEDEKNLLDYLRNKMEEKNNALGLKDNLLLIPQLHKSFQEGLEQLNPNAMWNSLSQAFRISEDDPDYNFEENSRALPIRFRKKLDSDKMSTDFGTIFANYFFMSNHYIEYNKVQDQLLLILDNAYDRKKIGSNEIASNSADKLKTYMDATVMGNRKVKEKYAPLIDGILSWTSLNALSGNFFSGVANILTNFSTTMQEVIANKILKIENKDLGSFRKAVAYYFKKALPSTIDYENPHINNKFVIMSREMGIIDEFYNQVVNNKAGLNRMLNVLSKLGYVTNSIGEHVFLHLNALTIMEKVIVVKDGKSMSLTEAFELAIDENGNVNWEGFTKPNGERFTVADYQKVGKLINNYNQRLFGIYNDIDAAEIQRYALGRMLMQFRKFIPSGFVRRFKGMEYDYLRNENVQGMYFTSFEFLKNIRKELKDTQMGLLSLTQKQWDELPIERKKEIIKSIVEVATVIMAVVVGSILTGMVEDDEEDNAVLAFIAYQANRHFDEMSFFIFPPSMWEIVKSPVAASNQVNNIFKFFTSIDPAGAMFLEKPFFKQYKDGTEEYYIQRAGLRLIPYYGMYQKASDIRDQFDKTK